MVDGGSGSNGSSGRRSVCFRGAPRCIQVIVRPEEGRRMLPGWGDEGGAGRKGGGEGSDGGEEQKGGE